jgi:hypothetical protein
LKRAYPDRKSARKRETTGHHTGRPQAGREIQRHLDLDELLAILRDSLECLAVEPGLLFAYALPEDEVTRLYGPRCEPQPERRHARYGHRRGIATLARHKVTRERPRVRRGDGGGEVPL